MGPKPYVQGPPRRTRDEDPATREVLDAFRRIVRALRESSRAAERSVGIGAAQLFVLHRLAASPALSLNELAARTLTHQSSVSVVVSRLVDRGLVTRARSGDDGRRVAISVTPAGRALLARAPAAAQEHLLDGLAQMGAARRRQLADLLGRLVHRMALPDQPPPMLFEAPNDRVRPKARSGRSPGFRPRRSSGVR